ncbi:hypothetical protein EDL99_09265 [Ornithobacterium rhinotracheale]|uniref:hypothetical protein n=1 Tax=Ornithobacterium rhinotracheale TaxID=28251 RepID=UPI00129C1A6D|nr:hypothetical protein [Ornithobacterium rhinotracheale]MRJ09047.1 hypothetical protein [Ornithobacterium rhinotracheale]UOH77819.1 hypothetical protein MT996_11540 [Ornithobacterium rhinotracheale]
MNYPISLDTALQIVGSLKIKAIQEKEQIRDRIAREEIEQRIKMFSEEERMLYGTDDLVRLSVMDKVVNYYSPIIKKLNA